MAVWNIDTTHTDASFTVRHMMISNVRGGFEKVTGTINFDPANPAATTVEATIDVASVNTRAVDRDNHLRSADFFDVANHPHMTFKSTGFKLNGQNSGVLTGDLTIRGTTRPVELAVEFLGEGVSPFGGAKVVSFTGATKINREDFGLMWNVALETGGVLVGKEIKIELDVEAVQVTETAPA